MTADDRVRQAGAYLRMLLLRPGDYRALWQQWCGPTAPGEINYPAVARVLSARDEPGTVGVVTRALEGSDLSVETAERFVAAFSVRPRHSGRLFDLLSGSEAVRVIADDLKTPAELRQVAAPPGHETLSLHESHTLGPDGLPAEHQTIQVIRSTVDNLTTLPYAFDTDELAVEVVRGGRVGDRVYRVTDTVYAVDILLTEPLAKGQTALLQLRTTFFYKSPPPPEFRRGVLGATKDLTLWVTFHPARKPARIWLARWDGVDHAKVIEEEQVELDAELSVHCRFDTVERSVVGFHWSWD